MAQPPPARPRFPVQLEDFGAIKKIAARAGISGPGGIKGIEKSAFSSQLLAPPDFRSVRQRMVRRLAAQGVGDARVLAALAIVERHRFVESALATQAYEDTSLPIGWGQTISKPNVVARMLELLVQPYLQSQLPSAALVPGRVLEIGTGCGYQAALLALLFSEVVSVERIAGLHRRASEILFPQPGQILQPRLQLLLADGMAGHAPSAPFAGIIAAAGGDCIPAAWTEQLAVGGRLVAPLLGEDIRNPALQRLVVIDKSTQGLHKRVLEAVHFVPLKSGVQYF